MLIKPGERSTKIPVIKELLKFAECPIEEPVYSDELVNEIILFQQQHNLTPDGIIGPQTLNTLWTVFLGSNTCDKDKLIPPLYNQLNQVFGNPLDPDWFGNNMGICDLSDLKYNLNHVTYSWNNNSAFHHTNYFGFKCHQLLTAKFKEAFTTIVDIGLENEIETFGGCYNVRYMRGGKKLSTHSWGIAIDLNPNTNQMGTKGDMHPRIVEVFEDLDFIWGGRWKRSDPMHFQFCDQ